MILVKPTAEELFKQRCLYRTVLRYIKYVVAIPSQKAKYKIILSKHLEAQRFTKRRILMELEKFDNPKSNYANVLCRMEAGKIFREGFKNVQYKTLTEAHEDGLHKWELYKRELQDIKDHHEKIPEPPVKFGWHELNCVTLRRKQIPDYSSDTFRNPKDYKIVLEDGRPTFVVDRWDSLDPDNFNHKAWQEKFRTLEDSGVVDKTEQEKKWQNIFSKMEDLSQEKTV